MDKAIARKWVSSGRNMMVGFAFRGKKNKDGGSRQRSIGGSSDSDGARGVAPFKEPEGGTEKEGLLGGQGRYTPGGGTASFSKDEVSPLLNVYSEKLQKIKNVLEYLAPGK